MAATPRAPLTDLRDRILSLERHCPRDLADNPLQHKDHPEHQQDVLTGLLQEVGIAGALLVYRSESNGGRLTLVDGHQRKGLAPDVPWPCLLTDLDDAEAAKILAVGDEVARLATYRPNRVPELLAAVATSNAAVTSILEELNLHAQAAQLVASAAEAGRSPSARAEAIKRRVGTVKAVFSVEQMDVVEGAIRAAHIPNRGEAITAICAFYLEHHGKANPEG
jgi:hypothetical protein